MRRLPPALGLYLIASVIIIGSGPVACSHERNSPSSTIAQPTAEERATRTATLTTTPTASHTPPPSATPSPSATATATPSLTPTHTPGPAPQVVAVHPLDGDAGMPADAPLVIAFDLPMQPASVEGNLVISPTMPGAITWPSHQRLVFTPEESWREGVDYVATLHAGALGAHNGALNESLTLRFRRAEADYIGRGAPVPALMYHQFRELDDDASATQRTWTVSPGAFAEQMRYLAAEGWHTISPNDLADYLVHAEPLPPRAFVLTIDDAYREAYTVAYPLLQELGFQPILFVIPGYMGYSAYVNWEHLHELVSSGWIIGCHSYDHVPLRGLNAAELERQINQAGQILADRLGVPVDSYSYPYSRLDATVIKMLRDTGYRTAFTLNPLAYQPRDNLLLLNRLNVPYDMSLEEFVQLLKTGRPRGFSSLPGDDLGEQTIARTWGQDWTP
jgi:peptidoglycan/xylan/chitin deacetylase (PgdA/CDA1 family)